MRRLIGYAYLFILIAYFMRELSAYYVKRDYFWIIGPWKTAFLFYHVQNHCLPPKKIPKRKTTTKNCYCFDLLIQKMK